MTRRSLAVCQGPVDSLVWVFDWSVVDGSLVAGIVDHFRICKDGLTLYLPNQPMPASLVELQEPS